jgi:ketosteroid isomerase-like protein
LDPVDSVDPIDPVQLIRSGYEAYHRRDFATIFSLLDPTIEIYQTELLPWGAHYRGIEQARTFFQKLSEHTEGLPEPNEIFAAGEDVIAVGRLRGRARQSGLSYDLAIAHRWTVRAGKVVRFEAFIDTPTMLQALDG